MRKVYPYLNDSYNNTFSELTEKSNFLAEIDSFINQKQYVKITLLNWSEEPLREIAGELTSGTISKDGSSAVRRTCTLSASVSAGEYNVEDSKMDFAINKKIFIEIGIKNYTDKYPEYPILWFPQGVFFISSFSVSAGANSSVNINLSLKDKMARLNGDIGGTFQSTTILDELDTQSASGQYVSKKVLVYDIIQEIVNHFGGEDLNNIVIEDVPLRIKRVMKWNGEKPIYLIPQGDLGSYIWYQVETSKPSTISSGTQTINVGDDAGYIYDDFYYTDELVANAGDTVVSVLDTLKNYLGNYEYYYDEFGVFHFKEIKNYMNTTQGKLVLEDMSKNDYLIETSTGKSVYTFSDNVNMINITATPQYENIKNDFVVQGLKKMTNSNISFPVMYHLAIDTKPTVGNTYYNFLIYQEEKTNEKKGYFPLYVPSEADLPMPGNFNIIYRVGNTENFLYWDNDVYKPVTVIKYYWPQTSSSQGYVTKDWRTEIYLQGLLTKNNGLDSGIYFNKLKDSEMSPLSTEIPEWIRNIYLSNKSNRLDVDFYFQELEAFWPQIYDLEKQQFYGEQEDLSSQRVSLTTGNYFLDFIDPYEAGLGQYAVQNIGRRTNVTNNEDINCLFEPQIPDIVFINNDDENYQELVEECQSKGQPFTKVRSDVYWDFLTGGYNNSAFDQIKYDLYLHTDYQETLSLVTLPVFYLEPNIRTTINDKTTNTYGDFLINNLSIPLGAGNTMAVSCSRCLERYF